MEGTKVLNPQYHHSCTLCRIIICTVNSGLGHVTPVRDCISRLKVCLTFTCTDGSVSPKGGKGGAAPLFYPGAPPSFQVYIHIKTQDNKMYNAQTNSLKAVKIPPPPSF